ncbi:MAG: MBL fold metallo-hydrolase [Patescibacteria group bacterium]
MNEKLTLTCYGGVGVVTGANFLLENKNKKILIDCGLRQGDRFGEEENYENFPYKPESIDLLFITHAHMDHIGRIPKLIKDGFRGIIYSTRETKLLAEVMFADAVSLLRREASERKIEPLYEEKDVKKSLSLWNEISYRVEKDLGNGFRVYLKDAGHILGSSMVEIRFNNKKILFTGDLGNSPAPLLNDTESSEGADYLLMESVYGDRNHETHEERNIRFVNVIKKTISSGGAIVIPAFSLERTQNILYTLNNLIEDKKISSIPVFVDSPLASRVTEIYKKEQQNFKGDIKQEIGEGDDIFNFPKLQFTVSKDESDDIEKTTNPKIILAGSGMSAGGRVTKHEKNYLTDPRSTILLVGYQSIGTLGRKLLEGEKKVFIEGRNYRVKANIENIMGFSSHKDSDHLIEFVEKCSKTVKKVFVTMGEPKASSFLAQRLRDYLGVDAILPEKGKSYELEF